LPEFSLLREEGQINGGYGQFCSLWRRLTQYYRT
jgi:hypothetical protein